MRGLRNYGHLLLNVVGLLGCFVLIGMIVYRHNVRFDFTPDKRYTLSDHSHAVLDEVDQDVEVLAFTRREDPRNAYLEDLLWRVHSYNERVDSRVIDLNRNPSLARKYRVDSYGTIIVRSGEREKRFSSVKEELLMAGILRVIRQEEKTVYFLTGHGERDIFDSDRYRGYTVARGSLEEEFYHVKPLSLLSEEEVPEDASVVVVADPTKDLLPREVLKLSRYLDGGGAMLALVEPDVAPSFVAFLQRYRVLLPEQVVADGDHRMASSEALSARIAELDDGSLITGMLSADPVFSLFRPVEIRREDEEGPTGHARPILHTSTESWGIPAPGGDVPELVDYREDRDERGPFSVGASLQFPVEGAPEPEIEMDDHRFQDVQRRSTRLVVFGDADFANNFFIEILGNRDLFVNAINWLAAEESLIGVRPFRKKMGKEQFFVSERQRYNAFWLGAIVQPSVFLVLGLLVFFWRKVR